MKITKKLLALLLTLALTLTLCLAFTSCGETPPDDEQWTPAGTETASGYVNAAFDALKEAKTIEFTIDVNSLNEYGGESLTTAISVDTVVAMTDNGANFKFSITPPMSPISFDAYIIDGVLYENITSGFWTALPLETVGFEIPEDVLASVEMVLAEMIPQITSDDIAALKLMVAELFGSTMTVTPAGTLWFEKDFADTINGITGFITATSATETIESAINRLFALAGEEKTLDDLLTELAPLATLTVNDLYTVISEQLTANGITAQQIFDAVLAEDDVVLFLKDNFDLTDDQILEIKAIKIDDLILQYGAATVDDLANLLMQQIEESATPYTLGSLLTLVDTFCSNTTLGEIDAIGDMLEDLDEVPVFEEMKTTAGISLNGSNFGQISFGMTQKYSVSNGIHTDSYNNSIAITITSMSREVTAISLPSNVAPVYNYWSVIESGVVSTDYIYFTGVALNDDGVIEASAYYGKDGETYEITIIGNYTAGTTEFSVTLDDGRTATIALTDAGYKLIIEQ